jgi:hypothetical protein
VKHHPIGLVLVSVIVAAPVVAGAFFNRAAIPVVAPEQLASIPDGWQQFRSADGGFSIAAPGPGYESPPQAAADGTTFRQVTILGTHEGSLIVTWTDYQDAALARHSSDELLAIALSAYAADVGGTQTPGPVQMLGSLRCQDLTLRPTSIVDRVRACLSGRRLFEIISRYRAGTGEVQAQRFIDSFRLAGGQ